MLAMVRSLQMIVHLPMMQVIVPANVATMFRIIIPIAMFDLLDDFEWDLLPLHWKTEEQEQLLSRVLDQMEDIGYESHNGIINLSMLFVAILLYFARLILLLLVALLALMTRSCCSCMVSLRDKLLDGLFFNSLIALSIEGYMEFLISGFLGMVAFIEVF